MADIPLWREREIRKPDGLVRFTGFSFNRKTEEIEKLQFKKPDVYLHALHNAESSHWEQRVYVIPGVDEDGAEHQLKRIIKDAFDKFQPSAAWAKDGTLTVVKYYDKGVPRPWDPNDEGLPPDFREVAIKMSLKTPKYMSMFGQSTYANGRFRLIFVDNDDHDYAHIKGVLYVRVTDLPEDEAYLHDGHWYMSPRAVEEIAEMAFHRVKAETGDIKKAYRVRASILESYVFNGRLVSPIGTFKGDILVSYTLNTDILIDRINIKPDIYATSVDTGLFQMFPQEQNGDVYTNRQMIASFYDSLLDVPTPDREITRNLVKDAMEDWVTELIEQYKSGELMFHIDSLGREEQDRIRNAFQKMEKWVDSGFSMNQSMYLLMVEAAQILDSNTPENDKQDKKRRLPVPFASRHSIQNATTYYMIYGVELELEFGEAFIDPYYGIFMSDETYRVAAPIWGGADLDDHAEAHNRVAVGEHEFFTHVNDGDVVMVTIRNPIGLVSNNKDIGTEYFVLKATAEYAEELFEYYGELPELEMDKLPLCSAQVELPEPTWTPEEPEAPEVYSKQFVKDQVYMRSEAKAAYGMHVNLYLACRMYNIPWEFVAPEEDVVDLFQQKPYLDGILFWKGNNEAMRDLIAKSGVPLDYWIKKRTGLGKNGSVKVRNGVITELIDFHAGQIERFHIAAKTHLSITKGVLDQRDVRITRRMNNVPILISRVNKKTTQLRESKGPEYLETDEYGRYVLPLSYDDFEEIGSMVVDRYEEFEADPNYPKEFRAQTLQDFREAHSWLASRTYLTKKANGSRLTPAQNPKVNVRSMYYDTDQKIMAGRMLDMLIEALQDTQDF